MVLAEKAEEPMLRLQAWLLLSSISMLSLLPVLSVPVSLLARWHPSQRGDRSAAAESL